MKKTKIFHLIILFTMFFYSNFYCQNFYKEGVNEYLNGSEIKAIDLLTKAIEKKQEVANAYMYRGVAKIYINDFFGSIQDLQTSCKLDSNNYKTYFYLGRNYFYQGFQETAIKYYNKAIQLNQKDADVYDERAVAKGMLKDFVNSIKDEDIAISLAPNVSDYYANRGFAKSALHKYTDAINDFDKAIKLDNNPQAYSNRAIAKAKLGLHKDAIVDYTKAIELLPMAKDLAYLRGLSYKAIGDVKQACIDILKSADMGYSEAIIEKKNCK
jgi:tetratricopeptide (TPR) repeat protein